MIGNGDSVEVISDSGKTLAIIVRNEFKKEGIHFFTPPELSQQLAYMQHPAGKQIEPHRHNPVSRNVQYTQEVLIIKRGQLRVDFYSDLKEYLESRIMAAGDLVLLITGGHGFEVIEDIEMVEVKQGPYVGEVDKTRFPAIQPAALKFR